ncbi:MAG: RluA family pseudouridine synthase [Actinomycetota bacterium]
MGERFTATPGRLDVVAAAATGATRAEIQRAIADGRVTVDGRPRARSFALHGGETVEVDLPEPAALVPGGAPVEVRYRDDAFAIVVKPPGVLTHPTSVHRDGTLVHRLLAMGIPLAPAGGALRPGIVHRLDAGTSGLLLVASTDEAYVALQAMLRRHEVQRRYLALVRGAPVHEDFRVEAPLGRRAAKIVVDRVGGRAAATGFTVLERLERATLLEAAPETGRTHQIRVHLQAVGHPIIGDGRYGGGGDDARRLGLHRPFLHAWRLDLVHPFTGSPVHVEEPLPADLAGALDRARTDQRP